MGVPAELYLIYIYIYFFFSCGIRIRKKEKGGKKGGDVEVDLLLLPCLSEEKARWNSSAPRDAARH